MPNHYQAAGPELHEIQPIPGSELSNVAVAAMCRDGETATRLATALNLAAELTEIPRPFMMGVDRLAALDYPAPQVSPERYMVTGEGPTEQVPVLATDDGPGSAMPSVLNYLDTLYGYLVGLAIGQLSAPGDIPVPPWRER